MKTTLLAIGRVKGAEAELCSDYEKRLAGALSVRELVGGKSGDRKGEAVLLLKAISPHAFVVLCDERGHDLSSLEFAEKLGAWQRRAKEIIFIIGGVDGVEKSVTERADFLLGLGRKTWPHRLCRVMLCEQIYRAHLILRNHPYHRE